jgi:hypothetical protein
VSLGALTMFMVVFFARLDLKRFRSVMEKELVACNVNSMALVSLSHPDSRMQFFARNDVWACVGY